MNRTALFLLAAALGPLLVWAGISPGDHNPWGIHFLDAAPGAGIRFTLENSQCGTIPP